MAQSLTITIANDIEAQKLLKYFCLRFAYKDVIPNPDFNDQLPVDASSNSLTIANTESKKDFVKKLTVNWWRQQASHGRRKELDQSITDEFNNQNIIIN